MRLLLYLLSSFRASSPFEKSRCCPRQDGPVEVVDFWLSSKIVWQLRTMAEGSIFRLEQGVQTFLFGEVGVFTMI
jgi:hypothetical protein